MNINWDNQKNRLNEKAKIVWYFAKSVCKWAICSVITGILCGLVGTLFYKCIAYVTKTRIDHDYFIYLLPVAGLFIVFIYQITNMANDGGTNRVIKSIRTEKALKFRMAPLIFISTVITHLFGGSAGREGAALQIGGSIGSTLAKTLHLKTKDIHIITMCGMSGVFAALFGTPITATVFSMEVISVGVLYYVAFIPCLFSAIIAYSLAKYFGVQPESYVLSHIPALEIPSVLQVIFVAGCCALISILFCMVIHHTHSLFKKYFPNAYLRVIVGGVLIVILTLLVQCRDYNGAGMHIVAQAIEGTAVKPEAFLLKILFTAITLGAGYKGGEIVPSFFIGATLGNLVGGLIGLDPGFSAAIGLIAMFCGVVNCPIASLLLSIELFGSQALILFCFACAISFVLSGYYGLYSSQKIVYSKLSPTYINKNTH